MIDSAWPAGTAQHSVAASKATHARSDELRSSGGSVGSYRTDSDLSNSQHDSYQGSDPSRPESSGTHGTIDCTEEVRHHRRPLGSSPASTEMPGHPHGQCSGARYV